MFKGMIKIKKLEDNVIKNVRNLFRLKQEIDGNATTKGMKNLFGMHKETEPIKERLIADIKKLFEQEEEDSYQLVGVHNFRRNNYIKYESNGNKNKALSTEKYLDKIRPYSKK